VVEIKAAWKAGGSEACSKLVEEKRNEWKKVPLNVAVIGNSGVGKSSFINAIRGLDADVEGAAEVGVTETTLKISSYTHPNNEMLQFWDLPGVGTDEFPKATYLEKINVDYYDFFLLITATRFTENDTWLGNEFRERNKKYFFVRTKIEDEISNDKKAHRNTHNEEAVMKRIRESTEKHLRENGFEDVPVFLIDNYEVQKFQFEELQQRLVNDFPDLKRSALILSLQATSKQMIQVKVKELRDRIFKMATLSGLVAMVPVPGVSIAVDSGIISKEAHFYLTQLGLDEGSLQRCAQRYSLDYEELRGVVYDALGIKSAGIELVKWVSEMIKYLLLPATLEMVAEETVRWFLPMIGSFLAAPLSFGATHSTLTKILDKFEVAAIEVNRFAAKSVCTTQD